MRAKNWLVEVTKLVLAMGEWYSNSEYLSSGMNESLKTALFVHNIMSVFFHATLWRQMFKVRRKYTGSE